MTLLDGSTDSRVRLTAGIFDVDGVLLASPHEKAWRETLPGLADRNLFTTLFYQDHVAGKPRLSGAKAALIALGVPNADREALGYAARKQARLEELIASADFSAFPDALRLVHALDCLGLPMAVASSSKNANAMLRQVPFDRGRSLFDAFAVNVCSRNLPEGKPDPAIFLLAAEELSMAPTKCFVVEDAPAGIQAARAGHMTALGVARLGDATQLVAAGADMVVVSLDEVVAADLVSGRIHRRAA